MTYTRLARGAVAVAAVLSLSACLGSGGGGGAGAGAGAGAGGGTANFAAALSEVQGRIPTSDMPTSGSATYAGQAQVDLRKSDGSMPGKLTGDLKLEVAFKPANSDPDTFADNVTGTAGNFVLDKDGTDVAIPGTLTAGIGSLTAVATSTEQTLTGIPVVGSVTTRTGAMSVYYGGELDMTEAGGSANSDVLLSTGGSFVGAGGTGVHGAASLLTHAPGSPTTPEFTSGEGYFWLNRQ
ncbi:hypothetical protein EGN72_15440 [Pseudorhodobacter sp. E13]|uniref:hypothetical protein n=1 Tax=Pseudorhodobacter sp. E13 TaxID=2487931 RepID=UPI000F8EEFF4|nr:hypothetical protein [Pseudorhodobacter sp. E13]RUS59327.1 hypothetical protein EGN72_15440 [Pseudorhodobacter sp. E13]